MADDRSVEMDAVWLRRIGNRAEVLVQVDGDWRIAITEAADGSYSHCAQARGFGYWPSDYVDGSAVRPADLPHAIVENRKLRMALLSIANSSCCGCCQEAALVAKQALK